MVAQRIAQAVAALQGVGRLIEVVPGMSDTYRVDEGGAARGADLVALTVRLGLMGGGAGTQ